jgi:OOP family OmpA-OmpF porin
MRLQPLLLAALLAAPATLTYAADAREANLAPSVGVAVEPAHRAHVISADKRDFRFDRSRAFWVVTEPVRLRALLPDEERAIAAEEQAAREAALAARDADAALSLSGAAGLPSGLLTRGPAATVYFGFNSVMPVDGVPLAYMLGKTVGKPVSYKLVGHTDEVGGDPFNLRLSERRAESVAGLLVRQGVEPKNITALGHGKAEPADPADAARNRRVEVFLAPRAEASRVEASK